MDIYNIQEQRACRFNVPGIGRFEAVFPDGGTELAIETAAAKALGFAPVESIPDDVGALALIMAHLSHAIKKAPKKFKGRPPDFFHEELKRYDFFSLYSATVLKIWREYKPKLEQFRVFLNEDEPTEDVRGTADAVQSPELFSDGPVKPKARARRDGG